MLTTRQVGSSFQQHHFRACWVHSTPYSPAWCLPDYTVRSESQSSGVPTLEESQCLQESRLMPSTLGSLGGNSHTFQGLEDRHKASWRKRDTSWASKDWEAEK